MGASLIKAKNNYTKIVCLLRSFKKNYHISVLAFNQYAFLSLVSNQFHNHKPITGHFPITTGKLSR